MGAHPEIPSELQPELLEFLLEFISAERKKKFLHCIQYRTRYMTIVLEDLYQPHNASAVLRTCDCFGIQDVHIIENRNRYEVNPDVALGSSKWLSLKKYNGTNFNSIICLDELKTKGYRLIATTPHEKGYTPETLPLDKKFALVFGTELDGLSKAAMEQCEDWIQIPMVGFTESLNISVSAAIFIHSLSERLRNTSNDWPLSEQDKTDILLQWTLTTIKKSKLMVTDFLKRKQKI